MLLHLEIGAKIVILFSIIGSNHEKDRQISLFFEPIPSFSKPRIGILYIVTFVMLPLPAIHLLAFLDSGAGMDPIAVQQPFNLTVRPAGGKEFKWNFF